MTNISQKKQKIKLKPIQEDKQAFSSTFDAKKDTIENSDITANYAFLKIKIKWGELSADQLFESIRRIIIIDISLNHNDNPQLILKVLILQDWN